MSLRCSSAVLSSLKTSARTIAKSFAIWQNPSSSISHALNPFALYRRKSARSAKIREEGEERHRKAVKLFGILEVAAKLFRRKFIKAPIDLRYSTQQWPELAAIVRGGYSSRSEVPIDCCPIGLPL
jgi:hypothetical protein